jgi:hypothetical protein
MSLTVLAYRSCSLTAQHPAGSEDPRRPPNDRSARLGALLPSLLPISHANSQHWPVASSLATEFSHGLANCWAAFPKGAHGEQMKPSHQVDSQHDKTSVSLGDQGRYTFST